jgi:hypothetical protein
MLSEINIDPATIAVAVFGAVTWLLGIAVYLGRLLERQKQSEKTVDGLKETISEIFDKLDELSKAVPHVCLQADRITRLEITQQTGFNRVASLEHWRDEAGFSAAHRAQVKDDVEALKPK